jgi:hypothetical protein
VSELRIQGLIARLDQNESALRKLRIERLPDFALPEEQEDQRRRKRALARWIKQDRDELKALLGADNT